MNIDEHYICKDQNRFIVNNISKQIQDGQYKIIEELVHICACPNMQCVEIGSWTGNSAVLIGTIVKRVLGKLYSIDWYLGGKAEEHLKETAEIIDVRKVFLDNINFFNLNDTVEQLPITSEEACKNFENDYLDFIFIDGDHSYEMVKKDINYWLPKLKKGKIIAGHDYYNDDYTGVKKAVDESFSNAKHLKEIWWIKKI